MIEKLKSEVSSLKVVLRAIPSPVLVLFCLSVVLMNLLANKEVNLGFLITDCGITISWLSFLCMDMMTKQFGPKVTIKVSLFATFINLCCCALFFLDSLIQSNWAAYYTFEDSIVNAALNSTIGGTWFVLLGSTIAFVVSACVNAFLNWGIGSLCKKDNFISYALRTYVSTAIGQVVDNFVFACIVSHVFFGWTLLQCIIAGVSTAVVELIAEVIFSPIGYKVCKKWKEEGIAIPEEVK